MNKVIEKLKKRVIELWKKVHIDRWKGHIEDLHNVMATLHNKGVCIRSLIKKGVK
jgi:hypothetical protein